MSMMEPIGGPRAEVSATLPVIVFPAPPAAVPEARAIAAISARAVAGDAVAIAIMALLGTGAEPAASRLADLLAEAANPAEPSALYALARRLDAAGRPADAALVLALLSEADRPAGLVGLAVLATRQARWDLAAPLVGACLEAPERHPRTCSLAGIGELERGDRQAAQAYLATAARLARRNPDYHGELQIAQRALLLMHLG